jgi:hypothetical protein
VKVKSKATRPPLSNAYKSLANLLRHETISDQTRRLVLATLSALDNELAERMPTASRGTRPPTDGDRTEPSARKSGSSQSDWEKTDPSVVDAGPADTQTEPRRRVRSDFEDEPTDPGRLQ